MDESALNEIANESHANDSEADVEMTDVTIKAEKSEQNAEHSSVDDDDVIVLPSEEPTITEITDDLEAGEIQQQKTDDNQQAENNEKAIKSTNIEDDDVLIQEPTIETQIVNDDDDDDHNSASGSSEHPLITKIKEEPRDDGYDEHGGEEDPFIEVTSINNDDLIGKKIFYLIFKY